MKKKYELELQLERESEIYRKNEIYCVKVDSIADAIETYQDARENDFFTKHGMVGSSDYQYADTGSLRINGEVIARISYNGKVWKEDSKQDNKNIFGEVQIQKKEFDEFLSEVIEKQERKDKLEKISVDEKDVEALKDVVSAELYDKIVDFVENHADIKKEVNAIWVDIGNCVYGVHIELTLEEGDSTDLYFSPIAGELRLGLNSSSTEKLLSKAKISDMVGETIGRKLYEIVRERAHEELVKKLIDGWLPDEIFYNGDVYTIEEYDSEGKEIYYGSPEANSRLIVTTDNRYASKKDLNVEEVQLTNIYNQINYKTREQYITEITAIEKVKEQNKGKREANKEQNTNAEVSPKK